MAFYSDSTTENAKKFKFPALPGNGSKVKKEAFISGFLGAVTSANMSAGEKVAWLKYAADQMPTMGQGQPPQPVEGPGPGFMPEGAEGPGAESTEGGLPPELQQILEALPGNSVEEKLHSALIALAALEGPGGAGGGIEPGAGMTPGGDAGAEGGGGQIDPALLQQLLSQQGGAPGAGPQ